MTEAEYFTRIDAEPRNTILVIDDIALANKLQDKILASLPTKETAQ